LADFGVDLRMYRRTQTQYKIYGSINTHVSREIAPDLNCLGLRC